MLRAGNLVRGDSSNLGHDVSLKCVLSIGNVLQCATAEGTRVGLSVLQEIPLTISLPVRYQELFRLWDTIVHKSQQQFNQNPCPHGTCLLEGENISKCKLLPMCCVQFSSSVVSDSLRPHESQHARPPCSSPTPGVHQTHVGDAIQPSHPLSSPSPPALNLSQHQGLFK